jgi:hypothetical protein
VIAAWLPSIFAAAAAFGAWAGAIHNRKASEYSAEITAREQRYETDSETLLGWSKQLLEERQTLIKRLDEIQSQVKNNHTTNLRDDLTELLTDVRSLRTDVARVSDRLTEVELRIS